MASVAPFIPVWNTIASVVPVPLVDLNCNELAAPLPPITSGTVADVVMFGVAIVGDVPNTATPLPVSSLNAPAKPAEDSETP